MIEKIGAWIVRIYLIYLFLRAAYEIRLYAIREYGLVIHEFDPWFNYRATEYLAEHGREKFFHWYDYMSWYPLGRPVGTTIYPGMQLSAVAIWQALNTYVGGSWAMSLNDVCCYIPAWFGVSATLFLGLLTAETTGNTNAGIAGAAIMSVIPAHIMRSVGGGYDNESIAMTAMCATFYFWVRSLRGGNSWLWGIATGIAYIYMVAAWGGYVFVLNMITLHAGVLVILGRYSHKLRNAYTLFYVIGTYGAMQVPVVSWTPLKSLEQLGSFAGLIALWVYGYADDIRRRPIAQGGTDGKWNKEAVRIFVKIFGITAIIGAIVVALLLPTRYFGPISSRIRSLFVPHTRTGNPLVDSVAEHQPAPPSAFYHYLYHMCTLGPVGFIMMWFKRTDAKWFLICYGFTAYFLSTKMMRLLILTGPVGSALGGAALGAIVDWILAQFLLPISWLYGDEKKEEAGSEDDSSVTTADTASTAATSTGKGKKDKKAAKAGKKSSGSSAALNPLTMLSDARKRFLKTMTPLYTSDSGKIVRMILAFIAMLYVFRYSKDFYDYSHNLAKGLSHPQLMFKAKLNDGTTIMVDDYREAYWWLRDNTPEDARVLSWWDYGYQITGIGNRTTLADGNTWNHEHIALLGRCLTSPEKDAHRLIRHLADYVLVWAGGGGDDLAKSPHMARIGNSVYQGMCPGDPTCASYGFFSDRTPTPSMKRSLLYKLHGHNHVAGVKVSPKRFVEVYTSKYGKVRIYKVMNIAQESKNFNADPANRICDAPGSWYCEGQYPPKLYKVFELLGISRKPFSQLEDFNAEQDEEAKQYQEQYHARMSGKSQASEQQLRMEQEREYQKQKKKKQQERRQKKKKGQSTGASDAPAASAKKDSGAKQAGEDFFNSLPEKQQKKAVKFAAKYQQRSLASLQKKLGKLQAKVGKGSEDDKAWTDLRIKLLSSMIGAKQNKEDL